MKTILCLTVATLLLVSPALADDDNLRVVKLTVDPAAAPRPLLRYRFAPAARQLVDGNAAALYYRAGLLYQERVDTGLQDEVNKDSDWLELSPAELPREEVRKLLREFEWMLKETRLASRRKRVEWDLPLREEGVATLLPEIQQIRAVARLMALDARLAILDGDYTAASERLEAMYALGRRLGQAGTLVSLLVGIAVDSYANTEVQHWIAQPGSPNAYWALSSLPVPLVDTRTAIESEDLWIEGTLPFANLLATSIITPEQIEETVRQLGGLMEAAGIDGRVQLGLTSGDSLEVPLPAQLVMLPAVLREFPASKRQLLEAGFEPRLIEAMHPAQVVLLRAVGVYRELLDETVIWADHLPVETRTAFEKINERFDDLRDRPEAMLANVMLPAMSAVGRAVVRSEQQLAMLRVVEALRLHAAEHQGQLPAKLSDITAVPVPLDPVTNRPFDYRIEDGTAILASGEKQYIIPDTQFEITLRK